MPLRPEAKVIEIGPDPKFADIPVRTFPSALSILSSVAPALDALSGALDRAGVGESPAVASRRRMLVPELAARRQPSGLPVANQQARR